MTRDFLLVQALVEGWQWSIPHDSPVEVEVVVQFKVTLYLDHFSLNQSDFLLPTAQSTDHSILVTNRHTCVCVLMNGE